MAMVKRGLVGVWWGTVCASVSAVSLGPLHGQAVMGQPLQLSVPVSLAAGESVDSLCPRARLQQGEGGVASVRVSVRPDAAHSDRVLLSIESATLLTEPYVLLDVTVGCGGQVQSRAYTVLVDLPPLEASAVVRARGVVELPLAAIAAPTSSGTGPTARDAAGMASTEDGAGLAGAEIASHSRAHTARLRSSRRGQPSGLETVGTLPKSGQEELRAVAAPVYAAGLWREVDSPQLQAAVEVALPRLTLSQAMGGPTDPQEQDEALRQRREAARAMWRALSESPEDAVQGQSAVPGQAQRQQELIRAQIPQQVLEAEERKGTHLLALALTALVGLGFGGAAVLWRRQARAEKGGTPRLTVPVGEPQTPETRADGETGAPWRMRWSARLFGRRQTVPQEVPEPARARWAVLGLEWLKYRKHTLKLKENFSPSLSETSAPVEARSPASRVRVVASKQPAHSSVPVPSDFRHTQPPASQPPSDFLHSTLFGGSRSVAAEELLDLQQQVDFFTSLGQLEQAVGVLQAHLADSSEPSPLAYLDLLKLYHQLGRRDEYEALRAVFNREFHGNAPDFDRFQYSRRGLERYVAALSRIEMLWPKPEVLGVIEQSIFRRDQSEPAEAFDLEAYRELLLLYAIARDRIAQEGREGMVTDSDPISVSAERRQPSLSAETVIQPLSAQASPPFPHRAQETPVSRPSEPFSTQKDAHAQVLLPSSGLDLDLSLLTNEKPATRH